jgi:hypothetical protein
MKHVLLTAFSLGMALAIPAQADNHMPSRDQAQTQDREQIYGYELMTREERAEYQTRMRAAKTQEEREQIRLEHHKQMQERAKAQGKTLPDMPPAGMGPGSRMGPGGGGGMGPGGRGY